MYSNNDDYANLNYISYTSGHSSASGASALYVNGSFATIQSSAASGSEELFDNQYEGFKFNSGTFDYMNGVYVRLRRGNTTPVNPNARVTVRIYTDNGGQPGTYVTQSS